MAKFDLPNLSKIKLPSGNEYRLTDHDLREMVNVKVFVTGTAYTTNEIIYYPNEDTLYRVTADFTGGETLDKTKVIETNISKEIEDRYNEIKSLIAGGTHYRGKTATPLIDGSTTNPIELIKGETTESYTAEAGDIVIYDFVDDLQQTKELEFIFDGTQWNEFGSTGIIRALAFADHASGTYVRNVYAVTGNNATVNPSTVPGATDVEYVNGLTGTYVFNTDGVKDVTLTSSATTSTVAYDFTDDSVKVFNTDAVKDVKLTGKTTFVTSAIDSASLTGTQTFNVDAISNAVLTSSASTNTVLTGLTGDVTGGSVTYAPAAETTSVSGECLIFTTVTNKTFGYSTTELGVATTAATFGTVGITTTTAATDSVGVTATAAATATFDLKKTTLGIDTTPAATATFEVTTKHIHFTPDTETDTVTVYPDAVTPTV
jgi:hypothetical protein